MAKLNVSKMRKGTKMLLLRHFHDGGKSDRVVDTQPLRLSHHYTFFFLRYSVKTVAVFQVSFKAG